jgi:hypothetical protein
MKNILLLSLFLFSSLCLGSPNSISLIKDLMNKSSLTNQEIIQIEKLFLHGEDRDYFTTLKMERRFFDPSKWKVESIFNTLILTFYNKNIVIINFNDATESVTINNHSFKINKTKSIWEQIKILFEGKRTVSLLYPFLLETAHAEEEPLLDIKKFIIFALLRYSTAEDNIKNYFKSPDSKVALEELNGVKLSSKDPISCADNKITGKIKSKAKRTGGNLSPEKAEAGLETFKEEVEVNINFTARFKENKDLEITMDMQKPAQAKIHYLYSTTNHDYINRNPCEINKIELAPGGKKVQAKKSLTKAELDSDGLEFLIEKINSAVNDTNTAVNNQLHVCFVYKGKNWSDPRNSLKAEDYIDCISKICENKFKSIQVNTLGIPQIDLIGKVEGKDLNTISKLSKQLNNDHSKLLAELTKAKLDPVKYECDTIKSRCYMSSSDYAGNVTLETAYRDFKKSHEYRETATEPLMTSVEVANTYISAAVACCLDSKCLENFNLRKINPSAAPLKPGNL